MACPDIYNNIHGSVHLADAYTIDGHQEILVS
jgi:hypothetical protein